MINNTLKQAASFIGMYLFGEVNSAVIQNLYLALLTYSRYRSDNI